MAETYEEKVAADAEVSSDEEIEHININNDDDLKSGSDIQEGQTSWRSQGSSSVASMKTQESYSGASNNTHEGADPLLRMSIDFDAAEESEEVKVTGESGEEEEEEEKDQQQNKPQVYPLCRGI